MALAFAASVATALALTPLAAGAASAAGLVKQPRPDRWSSRPTPMLGGVAVVAATLAPLLVTARIDQETAVVVVGLFAAFVLGVVDDVRGMRPTSKLVGQVLIAGGLAFGGVGLQLVDYPAFAFVLTVFWIVGVMNAVNLMDNMDGLAAGVAAIAAAVLFAMAPPVEPGWIRILAATLAGACLGFLAYNFAPARVYMGDAGSQSLGLALAAIALMLTNVAKANFGLALLGPLLVLGLPLYDTALVTLVRRIEGRPVSQGGRDHASHRLASRGLGERETVLVLYAVAAGFALLGLSASALGLALVPLLVLVVVALVLFGSFLAESPAQLAAEGSSPERREIVGAARRLLRFGSEIGLDVALASTALFSAFLVRFEVESIDFWLPLFVQAAPVVVSLQLAALVVFGVYRTLWRYVSTTDVTAIAAAAVAGTGLAGAIMLLLLRWTAQSRAVLLVDGLLFAAAIAGSRFFLAWLRDSFRLRPKAGARRVMIVGANETGRLALQVLLRSSEAAYRIVGFVDDDPGRIGRRIAGVPIFGPVSALETLAQREEVDLVVLATEGQLADRAQLRQAIESVGLESREFARSI